MNEKLFRPFNKLQIYEWTIEQIEEVASRLVEQAPQHLHDPWAWAADRAIRYLDARRAACIEADAMSKKRSDTIRRLEQQLPSINEALARHVDFSKGIRQIVGGNAKKAAALCMYRKYLKHCPKMFDY